MAEANDELSEEARARRDRIRQWYREAMALGISESDFIREMMPICGLEEIEAALDEETP